MRRSIEYNTPVHPYSYEYNAPAHPYSYEYNVPAHPYSYEYQSAGASLFLGAMNEVFLIAV